MPTEAVIVGALRTPIGRFQGGLAPLKAPDLGAVVVKALCERLGIPADGVDEVILGNVLQAGVGQNPARQAALKGGLAPATPCFTVNKVCGSGMKAIHLAAQSIRLGEAKVVIAGGMESMSNAPYLLPGVRRGHRLGHGELIDAMVHDGLWCAFEDHHMGNGADHIAVKHGITREEQDAFAARSHARATTAAREGRFTDEIVPVEIEHRKKGTIVIDTDEGPRPDSTEEALGKLRPVFDKAGTVTAGNASQISDGAAAVVVTTAEEAAHRGWEVIGILRHAAVSGVEPKEIFDAPVPAIRTVLERGGLEVGGVDRYEINEAFAAQALANGKQLGWDWDRVNVDGGAVALGHPIGASGARILVTLLHEMKRSGSRNGVAAACLGGGNAIAGLVARPA